LKNYIVIFIIPQRICLLQQILMELIGKSATHAAVFAQLYTPDGKCHGLHCFIVPIRSPTTLLPFPGVIIGDMGEKLGLNGLDNGYMVTPHATMLKLSLNTIFPMLNLCVFDIFSYMMFDRYPVSRDALLNKTADVSATGIYTTPYSDPNKRFGEN